MDKRTLSEISHLFLTEVRQKQASGGAPPPVRQAPPRQASQEHSEMAVDMTPEEMAAALEVENDPITESPAQAQRQQVSIVLAGHMAEPAMQVAAYARHVAERFGRVALVEIDEHELGVTCFERGQVPAAEPMLLSDMDARRIGDALAELSFDIDRWLIVLRNPKSAEARNLMSAAPHWVLLSRADDEGVVRAYRALKGLTELGRPKISLAVVEAAGEAEATAVFRKLDDASRRFLHCPMQSEPRVMPTGKISQHVALHCRIPSEKVTTAQWKLVSALLSGAATEQPRIETHPIEPQDFPAARAESLKPHPVGETMKLSDTPAVEAQVSARPMMRSTAAMAEEVIELAGDMSIENGAGAILDAVIRQGGADGLWVQCPLKAPMCPAARLVVSRDQRLILVALAGKSLTELRAIGLALNWMTDNRELIRMAMPQLAIDAAAMPAVRLLMDHQDLSAELIQPLMENTTVTIQTYRRVKWGQRAGLLLEAA